MPAKTRSVCSWPRPPPRATPPRGRAAITSAGEISTLSLPKADQTSMMAASSRRSAGLVRRAEILSVSPRHRRSGCRSGSRRKTAGSSSAAAQVTGHDLIGLVRMGADIVHRRVPGAPKARNSAWRSLQDVRRGDHAVDQQSGSLGGVGQKVAVLGILGLGQPGLARHRGVHLLEQKGVSRVWSPCRSTTSMIGFAQASLLEQDIQVELRRAADGDRDRLTLEVGDRAGCPCSRRCHRRRACRQSPARTAAGPHPARRTTTISCRPPAIAST